ncbi:putative Nin one binding (NOB1) Zn-ribbon, ribonuclease, PIN domain-containing protein [Heracleum sosnowskyi]|uniref:Nin one binding (NOB1) Zn-ribbon, ribonuclease, PIN domain-containing protein n=1 Tax=Heracleum sosnowskyi TaxID=360622 RepID=A0AAD8GSM7_9APIA|nr:putative Nin one binding (NOB1) Zn-ribbon, ribonuclease, PIN domain-containing protein [Heracleum sosnowskyi]
MATNWSNIVKQPPKPPSNEHVITSSGAGIVAGNCKSTKGIAVAVVDANAIIQGGEKLNNMADKFVSVSEVIDEVRDPRARHSLSLLPFDVNTMEPSSDSLKKVISFARETGDLQTLSDVDLKLIALTYTLEAQIHGTKHIRDSPPPMHTVNVKRLPEKDLPGWGSNVPNLEEWEALEHAVGDGNGSESRILPLKDLNVNVIPAEDNQSMDDGSIGNAAEPHSENQEGFDGGYTKPRKYFPKKKEVNIEGKMVADGVDASQGAVDGNTDDWLPAVSRSTHRRFLRRKARRETYEASVEKDIQEDAADTMDSDKHDSTSCQDLVIDKSLDESHVENGTESSTVTEGDLSTILTQMRLEEDLSDVLQDGDEVNKNPQGPEEGVEDENISEEGVEDESIEGSDHFNFSSQAGESANVSIVDDNSSEQSWMLRSLSGSSVACITSDYAMQNVILQMGLRLVAPGGMQIRELHRWILKCHACYKVTTEIGRIFCPKCGNGGTLRKVTVTVGENGIVIAARRPRVSLRGTKFSLPMPQGGRDAITKNPVLREDQLPQKFLYPKTKKKNKDEDDIFASNHIFLHHTEKKAPPQPPVRKALAVFSGKRNPNDNHYSRAKH